MRKNIAPKGSVPVVCFNTATKSYLGLDANHPLMEEDYIKVIGSIKDFDMNGNRRSESPKEVKKTTTTPKEVTTLDLGGAEIVGGTGVVVAGPGYPELKELLTNLGVAFRPNMSKATLQKLYDEALNKE